MMYLRDQMTLNHLLREELRAFAAARSSGEPLASQRAKADVQPFQQWRRSECRRCRTLSDALLRKVDETCRAAVVACRKAGNPAEQGFHEAALDVRCLRQECAAIRQELRAHIETHDRDSQADRG